MTRVGCVLLAVACCATASGGAAVAGAAVAGADTPPRDELNSFVCQKALDPPARAVSVQAVMRPVPGTMKMQVRFELMRQTKSGTPFTFVRGRLLGSWISPQNPTLGQQPDDVWNVNHPVVDLPAPATYRFRVTFRWTGAGGKRLASATQTSASCYQPELRADLLVRSLSVNPLASGDDGYVAVVANRGKSGAGPFQVALSGAGATTQTVTINSLGPKSSTRARFVAPACTAGSILTVTVDPAHTVDESNFANNTLTEACPTPAPAPGTSSPASSSSSSSS
jgi:CARDB